MTEVAAFQWVRLEPTFSSFDPQLGLIPNLACRNVHVGEKGSVRTSGGAAIAPRMSPDADNEGQALSKPIFLLSQICKILLWPLCG